MEKFKNISNKEFVEAYLQCWVDAFENDKMASKWNNGWTNAHINMICYPLVRRLGYCQGCVNENTSHSRCDNLKDIEDLTEKCNCQGYGKYVQQEYYKVDFTIYENQGEEGWSLEYAIEHENKHFISYNSSGWFNEFKKLLPIKCAQARVIIGYDHFDGDNGYSKKEKFEKCLYLLNESEVVKRSLVDCPIILIIFPSDKSLRKIVKNNNFVGNNEVLQINEFICESGKWEYKDIDVQKELCEEIRSVFKKIENQRQMDNESKRP